MDISKRSPELCRDSYSLGPLASVISELYNKFNHRQILECLRLLGPSNLDNYSEDLIVKLYENYSQHNFIAKLYDQDADFFMEFSKAWPTFMRNNAIMTQLTKVESNNINVNAQSETLQTLTKKSVLHPRMLATHLATFLRMTDKALVKTYLKHFIHSCAFLGHTDGIKMVQIS
jgi:hypothetical protein